MKTLIQEIQSKYNFIEDKPTEIKGHSKTIILKRFYLEIEESEHIEPLRISLREYHDSSIPINNFFMLSIVNCAENDKPHDLFTFTKFEKIDKFLTAILE